MLKRLIFVVKLGVIAIIFHAVWSFAMRFDFVKDFFAQMFSTQSKIASELLENKQIAEIATRKMKWKVVTYKTSLHEIFVSETVYTLKFGYNLSDITRDAIKVDDHKKVVTIPLPEIRLLSVDTFGDRKVIVSKKNAFIRLFGKAHDGGCDDKEEGDELVKELSEQKLIDAHEFAEDFKKALNIVWTSVGTYRLEVSVAEDAIDVNKLFDRYKKEKKIDSKRVEFFRKENKNDRND